MNITVTSDDQGFVADLVAYITRDNRSYIVTVDNDLSPFDAHASSETGVVATILDYERQRRDQAWAKADARQARLAQMEYEYEDIVHSTACPFCNALIGDACVTASGHRVKRPMVHGLRRAAAIDQVVAKLDAPASSEPTLPEWMSKPITLDEM